MPTCSTPTCGSRWAWKRKRPSGRRFSRATRSTTTCVALAKPHALVLHCLPAYRDQEISEKLLEERADDIFDQAENRLHAQKGVLHWLIDGAAE